MRETEKRRQCVCDGQREVKERMRKGARDEWKARKRVRVRYGRERWGVRGGQALDR